MAFSLALTRLAEIIFSGGLSDLKHVI